MAAAVPAAAAEESPRGSEGSSVVVDLSALRSFTEGEPSPSSPPSSPPPLLEEPPPVVGRKSVQLDLRGLRDGLPGGGGGASSSSSAPAAAAEGPRSARSSLSGDQAVPQRADGSAPSLRFDFLYHGEAGRPDPRRSSGLEDASGEVDLRNLRLTATTPHRSAGMSPALVPHWRCSDAPEPEDQGPCYAPLIWAYYNGSGAWSDGLCAGLQKLELLAMLTLPPLWPRRLLLTLRRAAPLPLPMGCSVSRGGACAAVGLAALLLLLGFCLGLSLATWAFWRAGGPRQARAALASLLLPPCCLLGALPWAQLLAAVGRKYGVAAVQSWPLTFLLKAAVSLPAMNVRVGLHVDRAHGYEKPTRAVRDLVQLASSMGCPGAAPADAALLT